MFPLLGLVSSVLFAISVPAFGQTAVTQSSEQAVVEEVDWEELEPEVASLSQEEFDAQFSNWENLGKTPLQQYLDSLDLFLETSLPHYEMQPYVLAECLWFQVAVLPRFQQMKQDGSLDVMMEMNGTKDELTKLRNIGDEGHLSNEDCAMYLNKLIGNDTTDIILIHISEHDNLPEKAYEVNRTSIIDDIKIHIK